MSAVGIFQRVSACLADLYQPLLSAKISQILFTFGGCGDNIAHDVSINGNSNIWVYLINVYLL